MLGHQVRRSWRPGGGAVPPSHRANCRHIGRTAGPCGPGWGLHHHLRPGRGIRQDGVDHGRGRRALRGHRQRSSQHAAQRGEENAAAKARAGAAAAAAEAAIAAASAARHGRAHASLVRSIAADAPCARGCGSHSRSSCARRRPGPRQRRPAERGGAAAVSAPPVQPPVQSLQTGDIVFGEVVGSPDCFSLIA